MPIFIDYSQYKTFSTCPWLWYEKYVAGYQKKRPLRQSDNALTLGSMVHAGLERWCRDGNPEIPSSVAEEMNPTPEGFNLAQGMVMEYTRRYPSEIFDVSYFEEPLLFPLGGGRQGLAKIDAYFYISEATTVNDGPDGAELTLAPGWWIREYKTKDASQDRGAWMQAWEVNKQADFQILALRHWVRNNPALSEEQRNAPIRGLLVQVLEKPRMYIPKRKCKGCGELLEMSLYQPTGEGFACPLCGCVQQLKPYEPKTSHAAEFFRVTVMRSEAQLGLSWSTIDAVALEMNYARQNGREILRQCEESCCPPYRRTPCDYFAIHCPNAEGEYLPIEQDVTLEPRDPIRYVGLEEQAAA